MLAAVFLIARATTAVADDPPPPQIVEVPETVQGLTAGDWHRVAVRYLNSRRQLRHALRFDPEVSTAINLACTIYGNCQTLWRKAGCETGHTFSRYSKNRHSTAAGLFQFLDSTWASTPFRRFSVYDPYANALAAGWMHHVGRGGEWSCR